MKKRITKLVGILFLTLLLGIGYACFWSFTGVAIPCPIHQLTGLYCPGCGVSRMCLSLLQFRIREAFRYNPAVFCMLPMLAAFGVRQAWFYIMGDRRSLRPWENAVLWMMIAVLLLYGILRNLPALSFLAPPV